MGGFSLQKKKLTSFQVIILGFFGVILFGTFLLMLPFSRQSGGGAPFLDALFTSTSAVCVTGLVLHDTAAYWSSFGQLVILILIQIGGMGVITVAAAFAMISGRKISLMQRSTMQEAISAPKVGGIVRLTSFGDSSINILVSAYLQTNSYTVFLEEQNDLNLNIMDIMQADGVDFAFPSTSVYIEKSGS